MIDGERADWNDSLSFLVRQCSKDSERWFPGKTQSLAFMALALGGEVGEVQNIIKKIERGTTEFSAVRADLEEEIVDVLIYLCNLMGLPDFHGTDWMKVWYEKRNHNAHRFDPRIQAFRKRNGVAQ